MITVNDFVHKHGSFWRATFPAMDNYVRVINSGAYTRLLDEMPWSKDDLRNYLISEVAFCLNKNRNISLSGVDDAFNEAVIRLSGLPGTQRQLDGMTEAELSMSIKLADRIRIMISSVSRSTATFDPEFPGCGALSKSYGDIELEDLLIEIKAVDRSFRVTDFRQILVYFFMNISAKKGDINKLCVMNPRRGIIYSDRMDQFIYDSSGLNVMDAHSAFVSAVGMGGTSR